MAQVQVTIAGKAYRMACGEGEEQHLEVLAAGLDAKVAEMRTAFGEIGDMRLHVMAALTISDELAETKRRLASLERDVRVIADESDGRKATEARLAEVIVNAAERIDALSRALSPQSAAQPG